MISDFEYLYMFRQECSLTYDRFCSKYEALLWKSSHELYHLYRPDGIQVDDLYQEGRLGLLEAFHSYQESKEVGLAYFVKLCIESEIKRLLRRCKGKTYMMLDTQFSLDISISEDDSVYLLDLMSCQNNDYNPIFYAKMKESKRILKKRLASLNKLENKIYYFWNQGYSYLEIAKLTKTDRKRIDNVIQKIKRLSKNPSND